MKVAVHWFRRDLRLEDNTALSAACASGLPVLPVFIFDRNILDELDAEDARVTFIHSVLSDIQRNLNEAGCGLQTYHATPADAWNQLTEEFEIAEVYCNDDYEPYARQRDKEIADFVASKGIAFKTFKDHVVFEKDEVVKDDGNPYTVYTPYSRKWLARFENTAIDQLGSPDLSCFAPGTGKLVSLEAMGFKESSIHVPAYTLEKVSRYEATRDFPAQEGTSLLGTHLRFGTVSVRSMFAETMGESLTFAKELIWREFFMQILWHFPRVVNENFKTKYNGIQWLNSENDFERWCQGNTGYPMVDAGMRELNATGFMHNRVRMVVASFLCKHLLIDWRWGEAYFAARLNDYELASNNGNWQWAAGTGCDAAPYFRVFNPASQATKFDPKFEYIKKWVPEISNGTYGAPMIDHAFARKRAIDTYKVGLAAS